MWGMILYLYLVSLSLGKKIAVNLHDRFTTALLVTAISIFNQIARNLQAHSLMLVLISLYMSQLCTRTYFPFPQ